MRSWSTQRLLLRQLGPDSAGRVAEYLAASRESHAPWDPIRPTDWWESAVVARRLEQEIWDADADRQLVFYLSSPDQPHRIIGRIAVNNIIRGALQGCAVGYGLSPDATGNGFMTEALNRVVEIAFTDLNLHRVEVNVVTRNAPSIAVAERCGFEREGISPRFLHIAGAWEDHVRFARVNDAWIPA